MQIAIGLRKRRSYFLKPVFSIIIFRYKYKFISTYPVAFSEVTEIVLQTVCNRLYELISFYVSICIIYEFKIVYIKYCDKQLGISVAADVPYLLHI